MKYEICKGIEKEGAVIWTCIAWTDVLTCAEDIFFALNTTYNNPFAILKWGTIIQRS